MNDFLSGSYCSGCNDNKKFHSSFLSVKYSCSLIEYFDFSINYTLPNNNNQAKGIELVYIKLRDSRFFF